MGWRKPQMGLAYHKIWKQLVRGFILFYSILFYSIVSAKTPTILNILLYSYSRWIYNFIEFLSQLFCHQDWASIRYTWYWHWIWYWPSPTCQLFHHPTLLWQATGTGHRNHPDRAQCRSVPVLCIEWVPAFNLWIWRKLINFVWYFSELDTNWNVDDDARTVNRSF